MMVIGVPCGTPQTRWRKQLKTFSAKSRIVGFTNATKVVVHCLIIWAMERRSVLGFLDGRKPLEVTATVDQPKGLEVDEHSIVVATYEMGLSKFETRWGTFTDPWTNQPQPKCGFVVVGTEGTISSYDYESTIYVQSLADQEGEVLAVDQLEMPFQNPVQYMLDCLEKDKPIEGPLSVEIARVGQQIVDTAVRSASEKRTISLLD